jgi:hypothetical protein
LQTLVVTVGETGLPGHVVEVGIEATLGYDRRIELLERTAGGIARISKEGEVCTMTLGIQSVELHEGQEDLPTHLEALGIARATQSERDGAYRAHISRHIIAHLSVATGDGTDQ